MAWEWVGPTVVTGVVALAGMALTWRSGQKSQETAERLHKQQLDHELRKVAEERTQNRLGDTYVELLTMAEEVGQWASTVRPIMDTNPPQPVPPLPDLRQQARVGALVGAFGSDRIRDLMDEWMTVVKKMISTHELIDVEASDRQTGRPTTRQGPSLYGVIQDLRPKEREARAELTDCIARELGHRQSPRAK